MNFRSRIIREYRKKERKKGCTSNAKSLLPRAEADNDHRGRDRGRKLEGEREREWNELVAIYPPARITVSAFSVDIIATQLDYNSPPPFPLRSLTAASSTIPYIRGTTMPQTAAAENFAIDIPSLQAWTLGRFLIRARFRESRYRCTPNGRTVYTVYIYIYMCVCIYTWKYRVTEASIGGAKGWKRKKGNAKELELERAGLGEREKRERRTVAAGTPHRRYVLLLRGGCCSITSIDACSFIPRNNR